MDFFFWFNNFLVCVYNKCQTKNIDTERAATTYRQTRSAKLTIQQEQNKLFVVYSTWHFDVVFIFILTTIKKIHSFFFLLNNSLSSNSTVMCSYTFQFLNFYFLILFLIFFNALRCSWTYNKSNSRCCLVRCVCHFTIFVCTVFDKGWHYGLENTIHVYWKGSEEKKSLFFSNHVKVNIISLFLFCLYEYMYVLQSSRE